MGLLSQGEKATVRELINYTLYYSDNTAANALYRLITPDDLLDAATGLGLPERETRNVSKSGDLQISPKDYSNILLSLYHSSYLRRTQSNLILSYLSHTAFTEGLPAGVPPAIPVAHKVGYRPDSEYGEQRHDCGIVYYPPSPYLLCIMTKGLTKEEADSFTENISRMVYEYVYQETQA